MRKRFKAPLNSQATMHAAWFLYLLECEDGSIYTGITPNLLKRFELHKAGKGARYTRAHPPKRILVSLEFPDRSTASQAEYAVKQLTAKEKVLFAQDIRLSSSS